MLMLCVFVVDREVLSDEMMKACLVYSQSLVDASTVTDDEKVCRQSSVNVL